MTLLMTEAREVLRKMLMTGGMMTKLSSDEKLIEVIDAALRETHEAGKAEARNSALEEAAGVAEQYGLAYDYGGSTCNEIAARIRALKDTTLSD